MKIKTKEYFIAGMCLAAVLFAVPATGLAGQCIVTVASGTADGSLPAATSNAGCNEIIFDSALSVVRIPRFISMGDGVVLDGGGRITIEGDGLNTSLPLINMARSTATIRNVLLRHPGGTAVVVSGNNNAIERSTIKECKTGITVSGADNRFSENSFSSITDKAINLVSGGNGSLSAPSGFVSRMTSATTWTLMGRLPAGVDLVETYLADEDLPAVPQGITYLDVPYSIAPDAGGIYYSATLSIDSNFPAQSFTALAFNNSNTSPFSDIVVPLNNADFFAAFENCNVEWFKDADNGGWNGDHDGDGLSNGAEDADQNCLVNGGERDPDFAEVDLCPADPAKLSPGVCGCGAVETDTDGDATPDCVDACPSDVSKTTPGLCGCGSIEADGDGDGSVNCVDGCPSDAAKTAPGVCGCGNSDADSDGDGIADCEDSCPSAGDSDGDGASDCVDACPSDAAKTVPGACGCGASDADTDIDGAADCVDACMNDAAKGVPGACGCGMSDADTDSDGMANCVDACPDDAAKGVAGACGCGVVDVDENGDQVFDCLDTCEDDGDDDLDGVANCVDACPVDAKKTAPGTCGCGTADADSDGDQTADCKDACPDDSVKTAPELCGCGTPDVDGDANGTPDCLDTAPSTSEPPAGGGSTSGGNGATAGGTSGGGCSMLGYQGRQLMPLLLTLALPAIIFLRRNHPSRKAFGDSFCHHDYVERGRVKRLFELYKRAQTAQSG